MNSSLARLIDLIPPPPEPREKGWDAVEQELGVELPPDYKALIHAYGGSRFDNYLYVLEPSCPNSNFDLIELTEEQDEALSGLWEVEEKPHELTEPGSRLIPWGTTENGEFLYWLVRPGQAPSDWTVMVNEARGETWERYDINCTAFLASVLSGDIRSNILSSLFPLSTHELWQLPPR
ncbi:SMI1/KNR4 family protein [Streptomyces chattanoogensis]|uniref:SMI1/KNR4 family protein n=1 Tax=Streptomyces chattanoogensis TaxID=66876 RepID=UPI003679F8ED